MSFRAGTSKRWRGQAGTLAFRYRYHLGGIAAAIVVYALLGFFLAPWLVKKNAIEAVRTNLGAEMRLAEVAINPFVLSLRIDGLELDDPEGAAVARIGRIYVNFQASSLFRWAWTFDEIHIDTPELHLARDPAGDLNIAYLFAQRGAPEPVAEAESKPSGPPRLMVFDFAINESVMNWVDRLPSEPVESRFGPVNIAIVELNTLPQRSGQQTVVITTESSGTLSWSGSLQLNPLHSAGHATIEGSHFELPSDYIRQQTGFDIVRGVTDISLDYEVALDPDGILQAGVDNFDLTFSDVIVHKQDPQTGDGAAAEDREVLALPALHLRGGSFAWPARRVSVQSVAIDDTIVGIHRDAAGHINWIPARSSSPANERPDEERPDEDAGDDRLPWSVTLGRFEINRMAVALEDYSVEPHAEIGLAALDVLVTDISNADGAAFPTTSTMQTSGGGTIRLGGNLVVLPEPVVDFEVGVDGAALALMHPYIKPLADVNLDSGALNVDGRLQSSPQDALAFTGDIAIADFLITETDEGSRLGSWKQLVFDNVALSAAKRSLEISEVRFIEPYADIFIAVDGSVNLGRIEKGETTDDAEDAPAEAAAAEPADEAVSANVTIGKVKVVAGAADFEDNSLPLPFAANIADLNGEISTIATTSEEASTVALEGAVDEYGFVRVSGSVTPLEIASNTDIKVAFQNVDIPKFSAYTIPFAGREIASGKLDLDLGYAVKAGELVGENRIVLRDFKLGDKVEHPGAMSLPLGLAVALLKGPSGKIDIDLPVRGNVNDPEFRYGRVVLRALANLIVKIVASPFALLGNLVGVEADELAHVNFLDGRADLTPPEQERVAKLAEALALRPELVLEVPGVVDRSADGQALRAAKLEAAIEARIAAMPASGSGGEMYNEKQRSALEDFYSESNISGDPDTALETLRIEFTDLVDDAESGKPMEQFDAVAYAAELRRQLIAIQPMTDEELAALAMQRATNVRDAILGIDPALDGRIVIGKPKAVERKADAAIEMDVTLTAGGAEAAPAG